MADDAGLDGRDEPARGPDDHTGFRHDLPHEYVRP